MTKPMDDNDRLKAGTLNRDAFADAVPVRPAAGGKGLERATSFAMQDTFELAAAWDEHRASLKSEPCTRLEAVMLDERRGFLASWVNSYLGPRGGLVPGRTALIGGAAGAGKTSLGAMLAVDALAVGCPVLCWQMELSRDEMLEHLVAQYLPPDDSLPRFESWSDAAARNNWWRTPFLASDDSDAKSKRPLPAEWHNMLYVPDHPPDETAVQLETLQADMLGLADECRQRRASGRLAHDCNGLVLVDYVQLMTLRDRGPRDAGHEVLTTVCSRLAKQAGQNGMVLVLLSQLTKESQKEGESATQTGFSGGDIARMAHTAFMATRATITDGKWDTTPFMDEVFHDDTHGEARLITSVKKRGNRPGFRGRTVAWVSERSLHNADMDHAAADAYATAKKDNAPRKTKPTDNVGKLRGDVAAAKAAWDDTRHLHEEAERQLKAAVGPEAVKEASTRVRDLAKKADAQRTALRKAEGKLMEAQGPGAAPRSLVTDDD